MKRLLLLALLLLMFAAPAAAITKLNFQNYGDLSNVICAGGSCTWVESSTGGNNYVTVGSATYSSMRNKNPSPMTYSAATLLTSGNTKRITPLDASGNTYPSMPDGAMSFNAGSAGQRIELKVIGGTCYVYVNGAEITTNPSHPTVATNPSFVGWGSYVNTNGYDDVIWGGDYTDTDHTIVGNPETGSGGSYFFILKKDVVSPAAYGLANGNTYVVVSSNNMTSTFSKSSSDSDTMYLKHSGTGGIVGTETVSGYTGSVVWPLREDVFNKITSAAPCGSYISYLASSPSSVSAPIQYVSTGAWCYFNSKTYSPGDPYTISWSIDSTHWAPTTYTYKLELLDVYGTVTSTQAITTQTGVTASTWPTTYDEGVYYAALIATDGSGTDYWLWADSATLVGYFRVNGLTVNATTNTIISGVNVSITQGSLASNTVTGVYGNYTTGTTALGTGSTITINATKAGFERYVYSFIPLAAKSVNITIPLIPLSVSHNGNMLNGIDRELAYGRPVPYAVHVVSNSSYGENYTATGNGVGYYQMDQDDGATLVSGRWYQVVTTAAGYATNTTWVKVV